MFVFKSKFLKPKVKTMKSYQIIFAGICLLLSSCATFVSYTGDKTNPTKSVDVFYSSHDVTKSFKVIGHLAVGNATTEIVKKAFIARAKRVGADAIVITNTEATNNSQAGVVTADALKYTN
jgi:hypothetical protein